MQVALQRGRLVAVLPHLLSAEQRQAVAQVPGPPAPAPPHLAAAHDAAGPRARNQPGAKAGAGGVLSGEGERRQLAGWRAYMLFAHAHVICRFGGELGEGGAGGVLPGERERRPAGWLNGVRGIRGVGMGVGARDYGVLPGETPAAGWTLWCGYGGVRGCLGGHAIMKYFIGGVLSG